MKFIKTGSTSIYKPLSPKIGNELVISPSSVQNWTIPDCWALSWVTTEDVDRKKMQESLGWSNPFLKRVHTISDQLFNNKIYGWPNLFESSVELYDYLQKIEIAMNDVIVVSLSFISTEIEDLITILRPEQNMGAPGLYQFALRGAEEVRPLENACGFDLVGIEAGGIIYSSHQFGLRKDLERKYGVKYNSQGLIQNLDDCLRVVDTVNENRERYETVPWFVCRIDRELN